MPGGCVTCARRIAGELERLEAVGRVGTTQRTFIADCWVPRRQLAALRDEVEARLGAAVVVEDMAPSPRDPAAPVLMRNSRFARPFEPLVSFLELPRAGALDPTLMMALFLPLMFGAMVGDVGYGVVLLAIALFARRALRVRTPLLARVSWVLVAGAVWSIVFGVLFGELFGDLGQRVFGDWAVWRYRPAAETLEPLLLLAVAMGAAHVVLGLGLGAVEAIRFKERRELFDKLGVLLVLGGLFGLAGWAAGHLPSGALTPAVAAAVVGVVLVMSLHGALGLVTGAAGADRHARQGALLPPDRRGRAGVRAPGGRRQRAGDDRAGLDGRARRDLLPCDERRPGRVQPHDPGPAPPLRRVLRHVLRRRRPRVHALRAPTRRRYPTHELKEQRWRQD